MAAAGRIASAHITVGTRIHVRQFEGGRITPTTRKSDPVTIVTAVEATVANTGARRAQRQYTITTDLGVMQCAPIETHLLDTKGSKTSATEVAHSENTVQSSTQSSTTTKDPQEGSKMAAPTKSSKSSKASTKAATKATPESAHLLEKDPTAKHEAFAQFVQEQTGCGDADFNPRAAQLAYALVAKFQKSELNQSAIVEAREAREAAIAERAEKAAAREAAKAAKEAAAATKADAPKAEKPAKTAAAKAASTKGKTTSTKAASTKPVRRSAKGQAANSAF